MGGLGVWKNPIKLVTGHMAIRVCLNVSKLRRIPVEPAQVLYGVQKQPQEFWFFCSQKKWPLFLSANQKKGSILPYQIRRLLDLPQQLCAAVSSALCQLYPFTTIW